MSKSLKRGDIALFNRLLALAQAKKVAIPAFSMLLMEVWNVKKPQQREDIGRVAKQLSDRLVIQDYENVLRMQVINKVVEHYVFGPHEQFLLPVMTFAMGYAEAMGVVRLTPQGQDLCRAGATPREAFEPAALRGRAATYGSG